MYQLVPRENLERDIDCRYSVDQPCALEKVRSDAVDWQAASSHQSEREEPSGAVPTAPAGSSASRRTCLKTDPNAASVTIRTTSGSRSTSRRRGGIDLSDVVSCQCVSHDEESFRLLKKM